MALAFIVRRLLWMLLVLWAITVVVFLLWKLVPGDPARAVLGPEASPQHVARMRQEMALDRPFYVQYFRYVDRLWRLDLGNSYRTRQPVSESLRAFFPATLELALITMFLYTLLAIPLGVLAAVFRGRTWDYGIRFLVMSGAGAPAFWLAMILQLIFYQRLGWLPTAGRFDPNAVAPPTVTGMLTVDSLLAFDLSAFSTAASYLILPVTASVLPRLAVGTKITRAVMLEALSQDYIRTARAKGLREGAVRYKHALRNALIPVITVLGLQFSYLLGGTVVVEMVFGWPGLGRFAVDSINALDVPAILGVTLVISAIFVVVNFIIDIIYILLDPQISYD